MQSLVQFVCTGYRVHAKVQKRERLSILHTYNAYAKALYVLSSLKSFLTEA